MKKKLLFGLLVLALVAVPLFAACAEEAPPPPPPPPPEDGAPPPPPPPPPPEVIELIWNDTTPAVAPKCKQSVAWGDKIEELSGGRVKFTYYWSNTLIPQPEILKGVAAGVADVSYLPLPADFTPLNHDLMYLPFMGWANMEEGTAVWQQLYNQSPALQEEFTRSGVMLLNACMMPPIQIHMTKKEVKLPADLKGTKILSFGGVASDMVDLAGGAPVELGNIMEMYSSLETGIVEGVINHFPVVHVFGCTPLVPYHTIFDDAGIAMGLHATVMNPDTYNSLPPDIQTIFDDLNAWYVEEMVNIDNAEIARAMSDGEELGHTFTFLTPEEIEVWAELAQPLHDEWIAETEAEGKPARELYEEAKRLIAEYRK